MTTGKREPDRPAAKSWGRCVPADPAEGLGGCPRGAPRASGPRNPTMARTTGGVAGRAGDERRFAGPAPGDACGRGSRSLRRGTSARRAWAAAPSPKQRRLAAGNLFGAGESVQPSRRRSSPSDRQGEQDPRCGSRPHAPRAATAIPAAASDQLTHCRGGPAVAVRPDPTVHASPRPRCRRDRGPSNPSVPRAGGSPPARSRPAGAP